MRKKTMLALCLLAPIAVAAQDQVPLFTGEVFSLQAQEIFVPLTNNWQARISMMLPEGSQVRIGDTLVVFDGSEVSRQLEQQLEAQRTAVAKTERDAAKLEKELLAAEFKLKQAWVTLELASLKADIPEGLVGGLEFSENLLAKEKAARVVEDATAQLGDKQQSLAELGHRAELDKQKEKNKVESWHQMLASFTVYATQPGFIIYGKHPWNRTKFQEGDAVQTGFRVAQIADTSELAIKIWINGIDRPRVETGTKVSIMLDALPALKLDGVLESVSDSGARRKEWGEALYYEAVVLFESEQMPNLLPGMSALVEPLL